VHTGRSAYHTGLALPGPNTRIPPVLTPFNELIARLSVSTRVRTQPGRQFSLAWPAAWICVTTLLAIAGGILSD